MNNDEEMRDLFMKRATTIKEQVQTTLQEIPKIGLEVELAVIDKIGQSTLQGSTWDSLDFTAPELGATQLELRTRPVVLTSPELLEKELRDKEKLLKENSGNKNIVRIGAIPNISIKDIQVTDKEKYHLVPRFHNQHRGPHIDIAIGGVNFNRAECVSLFCSTQTNIQADDLDDAVDKLNRSLMISPFIVAVSGNARFIERKDTGIQDIRMLAWEASHDVRTKQECNSKKEMRIGLPNSFFKSIDDYFTRCSQHPFILNAPAAAFEIGIGLYWLDTRIKFINNKPIVEYRAMSTQPTAREDTALALFYIGRLAFSQLTFEPLIDIETVRHNRNEAMHHGLHGKLITEGARVNATTAVKNELAKAEQGLCFLGYSKECINKYFSSIHERIRVRKTPSDVFAEDLARITIEEALLARQI